MAWLLAERAKKPRFAGKECKFREDFWNLTRMARNTLVRNALWRLPKLVDACRRHWLAVREQPRC
jgi:hypothetical protein